MTISFPKIDRVTNMGNNNCINMRLFKRHAVRLFPLSLLAGLIFLCGCQSIPQNLFIVSGPDWHVQQGQALWTPRRGAPQFGGDLVLATDNNGRAYIQFAKTPLPIVTVQTTPTDWTLDFQKLGGFWKGHQPAPTRTIWLYLPDALAGKPLPKPLHFEQQTNGNWRLENQKTGEILEGFLAS
jgi:hypothetical protein